MPYRPKKARSAGAPPGSSQHVDPNQGPPQNAPQTAVRPQDTATTTSARRRNNNPKGAPVPSEKAALAPLPPTSASVASHRQVRQVESAPVLEEVDTAAPAQSNQTKSGPTKRGGGAAAKAAQTDHPPTLIAVGPEDQDHDVSVTVVSSKTKARCRIQGTEEAVIDVVSKVLSNQPTPTELQQWLHANGSEIKLVAIEDMKMKVLTESPQPDATAVGVSEPRGDTPPDDLQTFLADTTVDIEARYARFHAACDAAFRAALTKLRVTEHSEFTIQQVRRGAIALYKSTTKLCQIAWVPEVLAREMFDLDKSAIVASVSGAASFKAIPETEESLVRCMVEVISSVLPSVPPEIHASTLVGFNRADVPPYEIANQVNIQSQHSVYPNNPDKWRILVVCGETGIGKSTFVAHHLSLLFGELNPALHCSLSLEDLAKDLDELNAIDAAVNAHVSANEHFQRFAHFVGDVACESHRVITALYRHFAHRSVEGNVAVQDARMRRQDVSIRVLKECMNWALAKQFPTYHSWLHGPNPRKCNVTLAIDEIGKCLALVRGIASCGLALLQKELASFGFAFVNVVFAGTGTEAFRKPLGVLRTSTDPDRLCLVTLLPTDSETRVDAFAQWACKQEGLQQSTDVPRLVETSKRIGLGALWTNPRMGILFAKAMSSHLQGTSMDLSATLKAAASHALRTFAGCNGIANLTGETRKKMVDFAYWTLMQQSRAGVSLYSGDRFESVDDLEKAALQKECLALGLLQSRGVHFEASPAIQLALCTNLGVYVKPKMGSEYEELCAVAAARGCEVSGFETTMVKLTEPFLRNNNVSYMVVKEVEQIVDHLRREAKEQNEEKEQRFRRGKAVVVLNGPAAQGPDFFVLRVNLEKNITCTAVGVKNVGTVSELQTKLHRVGIEACDEIRIHWPEAVALYAFSTISQMSVNLRKEDPECNLSVKGSQSWQTMPQSLTMDKMKGYEFTEWTWVLQESTAFKPRITHSRLALQHSDALGLWAKLFLCGATPEAEQILRFSAPQQPSKKSKNKQKKPTQNSTGH